MKWCLSFLLLTGCIPLGNHELILGIGWIKTGNETNVVESVKSKVIGLDIAGSPAPRAAVGLSVNTTTLVKSNNVIVDLHQ